MKRLFVVVALIGLTFSSTLLAQVSSLVLRAERNIDRGNLKEAKADYLKALEKSPDDRSANLGLGLMLSELLDNYHDALPYLQKANSIAVKDSSYDLIFALGKCYHYNGEYEKALDFYNRLAGVQDLENERDLQKEINKRKQDCEFALSKKDSPVDENIYIVNAGKAINSEFPEYVPVLTGPDEMIFTSKRKDNKREEINYLDGKYYEAMYSARITDNGFTNVKRYMLPENLMSSKSYNHHQAVVSISPDSKKLFTFKDSKLYEIPLDQRGASEPGEVKIKKFDHYQNHAFLTRDGNVLFFTSDVKGGYGGTDIYRSQKQSDGSWGKPENLGEPVNTAFDEDAPYLAPDGTLYFASEGHESYGNYDIYKTYFSDGKWTAPENLGQPINSAGHDIFLVYDSTGSVGYFSSGRNGGFGDMDIYKIVNLEKIRKECPGQQPSYLELTSSDSDTSDFRNRVVLRKPSNFRVLSSQWQIENNPVAGSGDYMENDYQRAGTFNITSTIVAGCDTCLMPVIACLNFRNSIEKIAPVLASNDKEGNPKSDQTIAGKEEGKGENLATDRDKKNTTGEDNNEIASKDQEAEAKEKADPVPARDDKNIARKFRGVLTAEQLAEIGFNTSHILFDFNKSTLRADAYDILKTNISVLKKHPDLYLEVKGYADSRGSKEVNERISKRRAASVKHYLIKNGAREKQIKFIEGVGARNFVNECSEGVDCDEQRHQENRRVEFTVTGDK